ncbi:hypothetical protein F5880DRAFT_112209 [Lentinula raphanica]|nr:hypothetical protein F5880DRAFT_112209 [Lentinula raphanica]
MKDEEASNYPPSLLPLDIFLQTLRFIVLRIRRDRSSVVRLVADEGQNDEEEPLFRRDFRRRFGRYGGRGEVKKEIRASEGFVVHVFVRSFCIHSCLPTHVQFTIPSTSPSTLNSKSSLSISFLHALSIFRQIKSMLDLFTGEGNEGAESPESNERGLVRSVFVTGLVLVRLGRLDEGKEVEEKRDSKPNPHSKQSTYLSNSRRVVVRRRIKARQGRPKMKWETTKLNPTHNHNSTRKQTFTRLRQLLIHPRLPTLIRSMQAIYKHGGALLVRVLDLYSKLNSINSYRSGRGKR